MRKAMAAALIFLICEDTNSEPLAPIQSRDYGFSPLFEGETKFSAFGLVEQ
jgi:hypothetical protein